MKDSIREKIQGEGRPAYVEEMFDRIAPRYDRLNRVMTGGMDRRWRAVAVAETRMRPGGRALDVATGTGDLAFALARILGARGEVIGIDFSEEMLKRARRRADRKEASLSRDDERCRPTFVRGDALALPYQDDYFDAVTVGFGLRNIPEIERALAEMRRVLRPGGRLVCLELTRPRVPLLADGFYLYFEHVVPFIGATIGGSREAYTYLPVSLRHFPDSARLREMMVEAGFSTTHMRLLNLGTIAVHVGRKGP